MIFRLPDFVVVNLATELSYPGVRGGKSRDMFPLLSFYSLHSAVQYVLIP